jgi:sulfofructose kinase
VRIPFAIPPAGSRPFDVVGFGLNSVDLVAVVDGYPARNTKHRLERFERLPGGEIATAVAVCARLGWRGRYIGSFGDDDLGAISRASLADLGIDLTAARTVAGATNRFAVILVDSRSGERTILWDRDARLAFAPGDVPADAVTSGRVLIVDGTDAAAGAEAGRLARAAGIPTVADVEVAGAGILDLLRQTDAIVAAAAFPAALTGYADVGRALAAMQEASRAPFVAVTLGEEGSLARCDGREIRTPAFKVTCVDSTGAGDAFRAGFAAGCLRRPDGSIEDVLAYANAVAALNCRAIGARSGMPTAEEVDRMLYGTF